MARTLLCIAFACATTTSLGFTVNEEDKASANPIRKVVKLLQSMVKKVEAEGKRDQDLHDKYMCYCKTSGNSLAESIASSTANIPEIQSALGQAASMQEQLKADLAKARDDREAAKDATAQATAIREKEAAAFKSEKAQMVSDITALSKAISAINNGMAGGFLQTKHAKILMDLLQTTDRIPESSRQELLTFLSASQGADYAPQSGEIVGILSSIKDDMEKSLAESETAETSSISAYKGLLSAKQKEIAALTKSIEQKTSRAGEVAVEIATMKHELSDTEAALLQDKQFSADLEKNCATRESEWETISKTRAEEMVALTETIKILNDDDALELFKKTLPGASASFVQLNKKRAVAKAYAVRTLSTLMKDSPLNRERIDFIMLALRGKQIGFEKVIKMIDNMVRTLKQEQVDDENKKQYCTSQLDSVDDTKKNLERDLSDFDNVIAESSNKIKALETDVKELVRGIKELDASVAEASEQRKEEHAEYIELVSSNTEAKQLLEFAKNRLQKFYNPKLHIQDSSAKEDVSLFSISRGREAPPPPPAAVGPYAKSAESAGVIAMIDRLIKDVETEVTEAETEEKTAQADFEGSMRDAAQKRATDSTTLENKNSAKADMEALLQQHQSGRKSAVKELSATTEVLASLHAECDWLLKYFDVRKEARSSEVEALGNAKAVLSGADFSFL